MLKLNWMAMTTMTESQEKSLKLKRDNLLLLKIKNQPHPWYGTVEIPEYLKKKSESLRKLVTLTPEEKAIVFTSPSWADKREVKMPRLQLQQALKGNVMLPGEEELRLSLMS